MDLEHRIELSLINPLRPCTCDHPDNIIMHTIAHRKFLVIGGIQIHTARYGAENGCSFGDYVV